MNKHPKRLSLLLVTTLCMGWLALASAASNLLSTEDTAFVTKATQGGLAEVALGGVAVERAQDEAVRSFAERMVKDHGETNEKLMSLAQSKGLTPTTALTPHHQQLLHQLQTVGDKEFDREYVKAMVKDHAEDVAEFEKQAKEADDPDLRRFAEQTLPTLQSHLDAIRDIEESL